jgi:hypothetical protein
VASVPYQVRTEPAVVYGDWDDDPARRRTDVYFLLESAPGVRPG